MLSLSFITLMLRPLLLAGYPRTRKTDYQLGKLDTAKKMQRPMFPDLAFRQSESMNKISTVHRDRTRCIR